MHISRKQIEQIIFKEFSNHQRFTQDSPIYPDVWLEFFDVEDIYKDRVDLILSPHRNASAAELFKRLAAGLKQGQEPTYGPNPWEMASSGEVVVAKLTFMELIFIVLPLTRWWQKHLSDPDKHDVPEYRWLRILVGAIVESHNSSDRATPLAIEALQKDDPAWKELEAGYYDLLTRWNQGLQSLVPVTPHPEDAVLWSVNRNRKATMSLERSVGTTKADACWHLFDIDGSGITWAILDTGIDASHTAFRKRNPRTGEFYETHMGAPEDRDSNYTRVVATYDFTKFRSILAKVYEDPNNASRDHAQVVGATSDRYDRKLDADATAEYIQEIDRDLRIGRLLDWTVISPLLRVPHNIDQYDPPRHPHGTHVAGIVGANQYRNGKCTLQGMCPGIQLYDIRVLDNTGAGDEFNILAALQFVRWMNNQKEGQIIHGINLSVSMIHSVASYACGATPVCESCERLVAEGTVVVAAAGNLGQAIFQNTDNSTAQGFRMVNITDPGNAESVITVGATHRDRPHSYGVSYFSSKGPTGDGRVKPDLVAPGEKIISSVLDDGTDRMDGTSMAAPHVSGAAALLMARHQELIGKPARIKNILCKTATDLGRERYFQGCGLVDVLRAIQSI